MIALNNEVFLTGFQLLILDTSLKYNKRNLFLWLFLGGENTDDILKLNKQSLKWSEVGRMKKKRGWHQGSAVYLSDDLMAHCKTDNWDHE